MFLRIALGVVVLQLSAVPIHTQAEPAELSAILNTPISEYHLVANNFAEALIQAADAFKIPMGITWVTTPAARTKVDIIWHGVTVQHIIEDVARSQPGYQLEVRNGIAHVFSTDVAPSQNFLLLKMRKFDVNDTTVDVAKFFLWLEIKPMLVPPVVHPGGYGVSIASNSDEPKLNLHFQNATVEDILDSLSVASTKKIWIVTFGNTDVLTPIGFRLTSFANSLFPDEQPVWEMYGWNTPLPSASFPRHN